VLDASWMPPVKDFDGLMARRFEGWAIAVAALGPGLGPAFAYADAAREIPILDFTSLPGLNLAELEGLGVFGYAYGSNLADGLTLAQGACRDDDVNRLLFIASSEPNTVMDAYGRPRQSFPVSQENLRATRDAVERCAGEGVLIDTVVIAGFPMPDPAPTTPEAALAELLGGTGGSTYTWPPGESGESLARTLTGWYGIGSPRE
jgi:hypothetical protein